MDFRAEPRIEDIIGKLNKDLEKLTSQKDIILQDLNLTRQRNKEIKSEIKESFWGDFLIGGLIVSGLFLIIDSLELNWPINLIVGIIILCSGVFLVIFRYSLPKLKEIKLNMNLKNLEVKSFISEGGIEFYKGDYKKAISFWDKAIRLDPKSVVALNGKGATLSNTGKHSEALPYFDKALKYDQYDSSIWMNKGITKSILKDFNAALQCFDKVIKLEPNNKESWKRRAEPLKKLGRVEEALQSYNKVIEIDNKDTDAWFDKGITLVSLEEYDEALFCFNEVIKFNPNDKEALNLKGAIILMSGKVKEAGEFIDKALKIDENYIGALNNKVSILILENKPKEALEIIEKTIKIDDKNKELWNNKGYALQLLGNLEEASICYDQALKIDPNFTIAIFNMACVEALRMKIKESFDYIKKLFELDKKYLEKIKTEPYLENLRESEEFKDLIQGTQMSLNEN